MPDNSHQRDRVNDFERNAPAPAGAQGVFQTRNKKSYNVEIRPQKWSDKNKPCKFWKGKIKTLGLARYFADTIFHYCGKPRCHYGDAPFTFPQLQFNGTAARLSSSAQRFRYVQDIASTDCRDKREDFVKQVMGVIESKEFILQGERFLQMQNLAADDNAPPAAEVAPLSPPRDDEECETPLEEDAETMGMLARLASGAHLGASVPGFELNVGRVFDSDMILESAMLYPECYNIFDCPSDKDEGWNMAIKELDKKSAMVDPTPNAVDIAAANEWLHSTTGVFHNGCLRSRFFPG